MMSSDDHYIKLSGFKGIWTLDEVVKLLHEYGLKVKIVMSAKKEDLLPDRDESFNLAEKGGEIDGNLSLQD